MRGALWSAVTCRRFVVRELAPVKFLPGKSETLKVLTPAPYRLSRASSLVQSGDKSPHSKALRASQVPLGGNGKFRNFKTRSDKTLSSATMETAEIAADEVHCWTVP